MKPTPSRISFRRVALGLLAAVCAFPAVAQAGTIGVATITPPAPTGPGGWYNRAQLGPAGAVAVTYTCTPDVLLGEVLVSCPTDSFSHAASGGGPVNPLSSPAQFAIGLVPSPPATVVVPIKIDTRLPPVGSITRPVNDRVYDVGDVVTAAYTCGATPETSGLAVGGCVGPVAVGAPIPTAVTGPVTFTVTSTDNAGNVNTNAATATYRVVNVPKVATLSTPAAAASVGRRPTFTWTPSTDAGTGGIANFTLRIAPTTGTAKTYTVPASPTSPVSFTVPDDLAAGAYTWSVRTTDSAANGVTSGTRALTVVANPPAAPRVVDAPIATNEPRPTFGWEASETGGSFTWEITGTPLTGSTAALTVQAPEALAVGDYGFRVRQNTAGGLAGIWSATANFSVIGPSGGTTGGGSGAPAPTTGGDGAVPGIGAPPKTRRGLPTRNAKLLKPAAGAIIGRTPVLTWKRTRGASAYNLQLYRVAGKKYVKVISTFPRSNRYRMPKTLAGGQTFVWRIWPYFASNRKYSKRPLGVSWFDTRRTTR